MVFNDLQATQPTSASRDGFGQGLLEAAALYPQVVGLCADVTESVRMLEFAKQFPRRYVALGVAEQNLVGVAAGLAMTGKIPFAASYAVFSPGRSWDQLRVSVCYSNLNVKIIGGHAGISVGPDGATHQALEDIAITRVIPNLVVVVPCDAEEARKATLAIAAHQGPAYLRIGREKVRELTTSETPFELGKALKVRDGFDCTIIACGLMVQTAVLAANELTRQNISVRVLNLHTIKPIDREAILAAAHDTGAIVTAEEHQVAGGMGSAVAEVVVDEYPVPIKMVGMKDQFGQSGTAAELLQAYGMDTEAIKKAVIDVVALKSGK